MMIGKLLAKGLHEISIRPVEFTRPVGPRGVSTSNPPRLWEARISNLNKARPDCISRQIDPDAALTGAMDLFLRQKDSPPPKKGAIPPDELNEIENLI